MRRIIIIFLLFMFISHAYALNRPGTFSISAGGGYEFFDKKHEIRNSGLPFVTIGYNFNHCLSVEALVSNFHPKVKEKHETVHATIFLFDALIRPVTYENVSPYLIAGVGITGFDPNHHDARNEGNINAGVGIQYFFHPNIAFRVDARDIYTIVGSKNDVILDVGMTFLFG